MLRIARHRSTRSSRSTRSRGHAAIFEPLEGRQLMSAGSIDTSFGNAGVASPFTFNTVDVAVQPDGKTVVIGASNNNQFAVGRLLANGQVDTSFGVNGTGIVTTSFGTSAATASRVVVQPDGKILVGGLITESDGVRWGLARYNPNGSLDGSYGNGGKETVLGTQKYNSYMADLALQSDGKIVFLAARDTSGFLSIGYNFDAAVVRLLPNGALDGNFGDTNDSGGTPRKGYVVTDFGSDDDFPRALAIGGDGRIVIVGDRSILPEDHDYAMWIGRYTKDGRLDSSFDGDGIVIDHRTDLIELNTVAVDRTNNQIYIGGQFHTGGTFWDQMYLARYKANGDFDFGFSGAGQAGLFLHPGATDKASGAFANQIILPALGKVLKHNKRARSIINGPALN